MMIKNHSLYIFSRDGNLPIELNIIRHLFNIIIQRQQWIRFFTTEALRPLGNTFQKDL